MNSRSVYRALAVLLFFGSVAVHASSPADRAQIVLVHGVLIDGSSWRGCA
ncbi:MAG TPA: hypothetical protein VFS47_05290 [Steroidobacteraceae bacterium]|nr:hypothetical protein [Steroidobacteraceae bacterium]